MISIYDELASDEQVTSLIAGIFNNESMIIFSTINAMEKSRIVALKTINNGNKITFVKLAELSNCGSVFSICKYTYQRILVGCLHSVLVLEIGHTNYSDMKQ